MQQLEEKRSEVVVKNYTKGNLPINNKLLNKYRNVREIFDKVENTNYKILISCNFKKINEIKIADIKIEYIKKLANEVFIMYHNKNEFINDNNKILVSKRGINESIEKICNNYSQRELLIEHLKVFSKLGEIIKNATLVNQVYEKKGRIKYNSWHYFIERIIIDAVEYLLEFEVVSMSNGENHYRVQRLEKTSNHEGSTKRHRTNLRLLVYR